ncbi:MAG TPA: peptidase U32, partial [Verrucomicrobiales bacterium]|nr:peptidase U32 [Verrucomicrobiales bacterium]
IHASTQMTVTSAAGVEFVRELGCQLAVLARENSLKEINAIQQAIAADHRPQTTDISPAGSFPLEVFVHGALCVAYSGQCLTSEALGGRSANRGECAQACRMPYELVANGRTVELGERRYLLSPQDLAGLEVLPELAAAGVASLKIEGRLKSPEYVASITRVYRKALDRLVTGATSPAGSDDAAATRYELEMAFSRGLYPGWFRGINNQELAHARFGKKRGVLVGKVARVEQTRVFIHPAGPVKPGDGVGFDAGRPDEPEEGGRVYTVSAARDLVVLTFGPGTVRFERIRPGDRVWKTDDSQLGRELQKTFSGDSPKFTRPLTFDIGGHAGSPLTMTVRDELGHVVQLESTVPLTLANQQPLSSARLTEQLGRLGGTPFSLGELRNHLEGSVILPVSELNRLRREAVAQIELQRAQPKRWKMIPPESRGTSLSFDSDEGTVVAPEMPELIVLVRSFDQLEAALRCGVTTVYCDFEDPKKYGEAVRRFHSARGCESLISNSESQIFLASPRITKPGEEWILKQVRSANADGYLVRNYDHLKFFADCRCRGDFSLNVANPLSAEYLLKRYRLERVTISYDLNVAQVEALLRAAPPSWFELTLHQHMPMFHMEHCVFCAFLSSGTDFTNCGRPCDRHDVRLRDRVGQEHPLKADSGCRNTVFNARAQTGAEFAAQFLALGLRAFRVEFVNETAEDVMKTVARYRALLRGELSGRQLWQELQVNAQLGVTRGQLEQTEARKVFPRIS